MVRLGTGGLDGRGLAESSMTAAIHTLSKFTRIAASHGVDEIIAAATSAVREANNGADFVARGQARRRPRDSRHLGHRRSAADPPGGRLRRRHRQGDRRSSSTSAAAARRSRSARPTRMQTGRSFKLGVIRLTERFVKSDPLTGGDERRLVRHVRREARRVSPRSGRRAHRPRHRHVGHDPLARRARRRSAIRRRPPQRPRQRQGDPSRCASG